MISFEFVLKRFCVRSYIAWNQEYLYKYKVTRKKRVFRNCEKRLLTTFFGMSNFFLRTITKCADQTQVWLKHSFVITAETAYTVTKKKKTSFFSLLRYMLSFFYPHCLQIIPIKCTFSLHWSMPIILLSRCTLATFKTVF